MLNCKMTEETRTGHDARIKADLPNTRITAQLTLQCHIGYTVVPSFVS